MYQAAVIDKTCSSRTLCRRPLYSSFALVMSLLFACVLFSGCSTVSKNPSSKIENIRTVRQAQSVKPEHNLIDIAEKLKGKPYRYGGATPEGFDCSGLVHNAYGQAGISIPRTSKEQYRAAQRLPLDEAMPGDLLFFRINSRKMSHVGIYLGNGRFIHASTAKKRVAEASLEDTYWTKRLLGAGRIPDTRL